MFIGPFSSLQGADCVVLENSSGKPLARYIVSPWYTLDVVRSMSSGVKADNHVGEDSEAEADQRVPEVRFLM
jgi:hypothetical protein